MADLCEHGVNPSSRSICESLLHHNAIHLFGPSTTNLSCILWIHNLFNIECIGRSHRIHQPQILVFKLLVTLCLGLFPTLFFGLLELMAMANFDATVQGETSPVCAWPRNAHDGITGV